jgi:hypothetical protein
MGARPGASSTQRRAPLLPISAVTARPKALLIVVLLAALTAPAAAFAQSAGDEQYSDPFAGEEQQQQQEQQPAPQPETPAQPVDPAPVPTDDSADAAAAPAQSSDPSLPVTGLPALTLLALGAGMLATGLLVRRRA